MRRKRRAAGGISAEAGPVALAGVAFGRVRHDPHRPHGGGWLMIPQKYPSASTALSNSANSTGLTT